MSALDLDGRAPRTGLLPRFVVFGLVIVMVVSVLSLRLFQLQVANGGYYSTVANDNRILLQAIPSSRGLIYDRTGRQLVRNVPTFTVKVRPADLPAAKRADVLARLSLLLGRSPSDLNEMIDRNPGSRFELVRLAADVTQDVARLLAEEHLELPGVQVDAEARREYVFGPLLSQVIGYEGAVSAEDLTSPATAGYLNDDTIGKTGVERIYESRLRGTYGLEQIERDASGREVRVLGVTRPPLAGASLELSIDTDVQQEAEKALRWGLGLAGLKRGVVLVMNPQTGEILAHVSLPTYDANQFARGISTKDYAALVSNRNQPLLDHAISEQYPPGSTYKLVTASGALADGDITTRTLLDTRPFLLIGDRYRYNEWNGRGWGPLNVYTGFGHSSDTFFYQVAAKLGIDRLAYWADQFGFGAKTGIDLPGEARGTVPSNAWKQEVFGQAIFSGETYQAGIGQGYDTATPLQVLNAYAALANGGRLLQPQIVRRVVAADGTVIRDFAPILIRDLPVPSSVLREMRVAARTVVTIRHTFNMVDLPIVVAGKGGTAEFGIRDARGRLPYHSWFVGFVPKDPWKRAGDPSGFKAIARSDSELIVLAFAYDSQTRGNAATEIVKYFMQLHFKLDVDLRLFDLLQRGNFYQSP
jgi:penicillin-binding protein 2